MKVRNLGLEGGNDVSFAYVVYLKTNLGAKTKKSNSIKD